MSSFKLLILYFSVENSPPSLHIKEYFFTSFIKNNLLGIPISELVLYFPDGILSYFNNLSWSTVSKGLGNNWKNFADNFAIGNGKGIKNLFLSIRLKSICNISLKLKTSGPTHSIILVSILLDKTW